MRYVVRCQRNQLRRELATGLDVPTGTTFTTADVVEAASIDAAVRAIANSTANNIVHLEAFPLTEEE